MGSYNFLSKYHAKKVYFIDGKYFISDRGTRNGEKKAIDYCKANLLNDKDIIKFDSMLEYKRYCLLKELEKQGKIKNISLHQKFKLLDTMTNYQGKKHEELDYEADFTYLDLRTNKIIVEDSKGFETDVFLLKWKLFDYIYQDKGICLQAIRLRPREQNNYLDENAWYNIGLENPTKESRLKAKEELKKMKEVKKEEEKREKKIEKLKTDYRLLKGQTLNKTKQKRLDEIIAKLKEYGYLLG